MRLIISLIINSQVTLRSHWVSVFVCAYGEASVRECERIETQEPSRKLRLICLISNLLVRELLEDELQNPLDPSAEEAAHDEELFDFAFGHNHMLLMAYLVLLLSAAKPYFKQGRTYSFGPEVYLFARIERACSKWPQSACKTRGARRPIESRRRARRWQRRGDNERA